MRRRDFLKVAAAGTVGAALGPGLAGAGQPGGAKHPDLAVVRGGAPAALFMAVTETAMRSACQESAEPAAVLARTNSALCDGNAEMMFVTLFFGVLDPPSGLLSWSNAGHNPPFILHLDRRVEAIPGAHGRVLGVRPATTYTSSVTRLEPGDLLAIYTDGVTEAANPAGTLYVEERLAAVLKESGGLPLAQVAGMLMEDIRTFAGDAEQSDDIALLLVRMKKAATVS